MRNIFILIFTIVSILKIPDAACQVMVKKNITLTSLSNELVKVNVVLDNVNDKVTFKLNPKEKLCINGYRGLVENIKILNNKFVSIHYKIRGGSGVKMSRTALICVSKDKLYKALDVLSMERYVFKETYDKATDSIKLYDENGIYTLRFNNLWNHNQNFYLSAIQYEKVTSKYDKNKNYEKTDTIKLFFDEKIKVFYTKYVSMKGDYKIEIEGEKSKQRIFKGEKYPFIMLRDDEYIFINNVWYNRKGVNHLQGISD